MASYPSSIYSPTNPSANSPRNNPSLAGEITGLNGEVVAIETALGVNLSTISVIAANAAGSVAVGGDLSGNLPNPSVVKIHGASVSGVPPVANDIIVASGSVAAQWQYPITVASVTSAQAASVAASKYNAVVLANGTFNVILPAPSSSLGEIVTVKNVGSGSVGVIQHASELIDGAASVNLNAQYMGVRLATDGTSWYVISEVATSIL